MAEVWLFGSIRTTYPLSVIIYSTKGSKPIKESQSSTVLIHWGK